MVTEPLRYAKGVARREQLLAAAADAFSAAPYATITMADLAESAGVAKGLLSYYFGSKRDLYLAVVQHYSAQLLETFDSDGELAPFDRLGRALDLYLGFAEGFESAYRTLKRSALGDDPVVREFVAAERGEYRSRVAQSMIGSNHEPPLLRTALEGFFGFLESATLDWLDHRAIGRGELHSLLVTVAVNCLDAVTQADPTIRLDRQTP